MSWKQLFPLWLIISILVVSCSEPTTVTQSYSKPMVNMSVSFSKNATAGLFKISGINAVDSIRIDSAVVIFSRIKFESHIDTVVVDSMEHEMDDMERDSNIVFRGPFIVHVRDTVAIDFANQVLPAGNYDGIKFKIHRLKNGERHEDSDERHNRHHMMNDSLISGSSISVWGAVYKNGAWTNFAYNFNGELEFKIKGNFTVPEATSSVNIALNFNMALWFTDPSTGALLDPTDHSSENLKLIRRAIYNSFGKGKGGHDRGDGRPHD
ncbi:MAG: hypothetical protein HY964_05945 [Ignavibacteriales bacterium]|nr:hypothetical protein [Ignavibacteriales bacterium]